MTDEKSNEITAVPELLESLNIEDSIVTADAMSCQKESIRKIREGKADYVISLKGNHPALLEDVSLYFERFAYALRKHWAIENQLHWCLDVIFDEDASRARKDMSPLNLNVLRKTALALCKNADFSRRLSIQKKRFAAALNPLCLLHIFFSLNFKCCCPAGGN